MQLGGRDLLTQSSLNGPNQKLQKYKIVRSSLFSNKPVLDRQEGATIDSDAGHSEHSLGQKSFFSKQKSSGYAVRAEEYSVASDARSPHSQYHIRSMSHRRLEPIRTGNQIRSSDMTAIKERKSQHQSINFNQGLTFVMVKGKF